MAAHTAQETYRQVLVVEDDDAQRWTLAEILTEEGLHVTACASATEALDCIKNQGIRVVVLDLRLPDLTGMQLLDLLTGSADEVSIIINTGHSSYQSAKDALNLGAFAYVEKAGDPEELLRHVHRAIAFQLRRRTEQLEAEVAESADELKAANRALRQEVAERKEAEAAVRESEMRFRELVEMLPQTVIETDEQARITFVNHFGLEAFRCELDEIIQRHITDLFAPEDHQRVLQKIHRRLAGERCGDHEYVGLRMDGTTFPILLYCSRIVRNEEAVGLRCITVDIADRRAAEIALQESKAKLESIFESSPDAITVTDLDMRIEDCNPAMLRMFGLTNKDRVLGASSLDFVASSDHERVRERLAEILQDGFIKDEELMLVREDGSEFPSEISASLMRDALGRPLGIVAISSDITARKQAETQLASERNLLRTLVDNLPDSTYIKDRDSRFMLCSRQTREVAGIEHAEQIIGKTDFDFYPPEIATRFFEEEQELMRSGNALLNVERCVEDPVRNEIVWDLTTKVPLRNAEGQIIGLVGISKNVTELKQSQQALQDSLQMAGDIVRSIPSGLFIYAYEPPGMLTLLDANPAAAQLTGLDVVKQIGRTFDEIWPQARASGLTDRYLEVMQTGQTFQTEEFVYQDDQIDGIFSIRAFQIAGNRLGVAFENVTERRRAELAIREGERRLATLMANLPGMAYRCKADRDWTMEFVSQGCTPLTGYDSKDLVGNRTLSYKDVIHPDDRQHVYDDIEEALAKGTAFEIEYRIVTAQGQEKWVWERGRLVESHTGEPGILEGFVLDVSERKKAEEALRTASTEWQTTFDSVSDVIWLLDAESRIKRSNRATADVFGLDPEAIVGRHCWEVGHHTPGPIQECPILRMRGSQHRESMSLRIGDRWYEVRVDPILGPSRELEGAVHILSDITDRKKANEELLAYQQKLKAIASELALAEERERRRIAADLHDHACQSLALSKMRLQDMLEHETPGDMKALQSICSALNTTIESVRELTFDLSSPTLYKFGLEAALEELLQDKLRGEHRIPYRFSDDRQPKPLSQDMLVLLFQSVRELLINVIKHAQAHEVALDIRRETKCIRITVTDDGIGFEVDSVLSSPSRGRSVGLFNIRERLDYIGGTLSIDSEPGRGTRFTLVAPLKVEADTTKESHDGGKDSAR